MLQTEILEGSKLHIQKNNQKECYISKFYFHYYFVITWQIVPLPMSYSLGQMWDFVGTGRPEVGN